MSRNRDEIIQFMLMTNARAKQKSRLNQYLTRIFKRFTILGGALSEMVLRGVFIPIYIKGEIRLSKRYQFYSLQEAVAKKERDSFEIAFCRGNNKCVFVCQILSLKEIDLMHIQAIIKVIDIKDNQTLEAVGESYYLDPYTKIPVGYSIQYKL